MSTNDEVMNHLGAVRDAVNTAINNAQRYADHNGDMTTTAKNTLLATVTTVPTVMQHASNCSICNGWDGST